MQEFMLGTWGLLILGIVRQYPWQVLAFVLVTSFIVRELTRRDQRRGSDGDFGGLDLFGGDGDGGDSGGH